MRKICFIIFFPCCVLQAQDLQQENYCDSLMPNAGRIDMPASLLIVAKDGKPLLRKAYGMANLEMNIPASPDQLFTLASVNKQMIAVSILQLAQKGMLRLSDDIRQYLPSFDTNSRLITIEQLLNHTSGIYSGNSPVRGKSFYDHVKVSGMLNDQEFLDYTMQQPPIFEPGTDWSWNTWAYHLAFFIVEKVSGMPFNEYVRRNLFEPAGMHNSFSLVDGNRLGANGIKYLNTFFYFRDAVGKWTWWDRRHLTPYFFYQRYSIATSLDDLVKWDQALREGKLIPPELLEKAWTSGHLKNGRSINYGLGWTLSEQNGYKLISSVGIGSNPICTVHVPEQGLYIVYTQFFGSLEQVEMKVKKILSRLLPLSYPTAVESKAPLSDYVGVYQVHRNGLDLATVISDVPIFMNVTTSNDTLYLQQTATGKIALRPAGDDRFLPPANENIYYIFLRDENKKVNGISTCGSFWAYGPEVRNKRVLFCAIEKAQFNEAVKTRLVKEWQRAKQYTLEYLDAVPKEKYGFKAQDSIRSFAQQMLHLAQDIAIMVSFGTGKERIWQGQILEQRLSAQAADSVRYYITAGYDFAIDAIQNMDASKLEEKVKDRRIEETRFAWMLKAFEHQTHHRGQATIYIRLLGIKPPRERLF